VFTNVLVGVNGRSGGRDAITLAQQLAAPGGQITLAHIYGGAWIFGGAAALALLGAREYAEAVLAREQEAASIDAARISLAARSVGRGLHELAEQHHADLLVVGSSEHGPIGRVLTGDRTLASLNGARCAVAIAPTAYVEHVRPLRTLGVGNDGSPESERALGLARALAAHYGSEIRALAVVSLQSIPAGDPLPEHWTEITDELIREERKRLTSVDGVRGDATYGEPSDELARFGEEVDLLIVGSRGYGPLGRLFNGSTSTSLARHAPCPLLVLPRAAAPAGAAPAG
jgi:nucleotide-binding universal stress UspA family protein